MTAKAKKRVPRSTPKPKVKKATEAKKNGALLEAARKVLPKLKAGETTLSAERDRLGLTSNGPLRKALTELLGGKKQYEAMMKAAQAARPESRGSGDTAGGR